MGLEDNYTKSKFRCPLCGLVIGCDEESGSLICDLKELAEHVKECRKRVKPDQSSKFGHRST
jgi:hypothetical protein